MRIPSTYWLLFFALVPSTVVAQSDGITKAIWFAIFGIAVAMFLTITAIVKSGWSRKGKTLLLTTYLFSIVITQIYLWPISQHLFVITACLVFIPITVVAVNYYLFDKYFRSGKQ